MRETLAGMVDTFAADLAIAVRAPVAVRPFVFHGVRINSKLPVVLYCRHPGYTNPSATDATILANTSLMAKLAGVASPHARTVVKARHDAKLLAAHAADHWENVFARAEPLPAPLDAQPDALAVVTEPVPVPMTTERVELLFNRLIDEHLDLFLKFSRWVSDDDNFIEAPIGDPADLGK